MVRCARLPLSADPPNLPPLFAVTQQLADGIRMLQNQAHNTDNGEIHLCHTSCVSKFAYIAIIQLNVSR